MEFSGDGGGGEQSVSVLRVVNHAMVIRRALFAMTPRPQSVVILSNFTLLQQHIRSVRLCCYGTHVSYCAQRTDALVFLQGVIQLSPPRCILTGEVPWENPNP